MKTPIPRRTSQAVSLYLFIYVALFMLATGALSYFISRSPQIVMPSQRLAAVQENYGKVPLHFEANQGQFPDRVKFLTRGNGYSLALGAEAVVLELQNEQAATVEMKLQGANPKPRLRSSQPLAAKMNYFLGNDSQHWRTNVPTFSQVKYESVYPGIDLVYYGNQQQLEYDFVVQPGADPQAIQLQFTGTEKLRLDDVGNLLLTTAAGEVVQHKPVVYQEVNGQRQIIEGHYVLQGDHEIRFALGAYDTSRTLVIDPVISFATLFPRVATGISVDSFGNAYIISNSTHTATNGAVNTGQGFTVLKLNAAGNAILYSAVIGGTTPAKYYVDCSVYPDAPRDEKGCYRTTLGNTARGLTVDASGNAYLTGETAAMDFPTTRGAFQPEYKSAYLTTGNANFNCFALKLSPNGDNLLYSTLLSADLTAQANAIAVDARGNAYLTGWATAGFPTTRDALQTRNRTGTAFGPNAFVTKLSATGSELLYSTYLGGSVDDRGEDIKLDGMGNFYVTGSAVSASSRYSPTIPFPLTPGAFQPANSEGSLFVAKFNSDHFLAYSALLGWGGESRLAVSADGFAYVTGNTQSTDFPVTPDAFQRTGASDDRNQAVQAAFVTKLSQDGSSLVYSTYLSGPYGDVARVSGIAVDVAGNAIISGKAGRDFPTTMGAYENDSYLRLFVTKLNATGTGLIYSLRVAGADFGPLALDRQGNAYVAGAARVNDFVPTRDTIAPVIGERLPGAYVLKVAASNRPESLLPPPPPITNPNAHQTYGFGGKIKDASGQGIDGVTLRASGKGFDASFFLDWEFILGSPWVLSADGTLSREWKSADGGYYSMALPAGGDYVITPYKAGYSFDPPVVNISQIGRHLSFNFLATPTTSTPPPPPPLPSERYIIAYVTENIAASTVPMEGATVTLSGTREATAVTDREGKAIFAQLPARGTYTLTATKPGYKSKSESLTEGLPYNRRVPFTLELVRTANPVANVSAATFSTDLARGSIVTAFGSDLAVATRSATTIPLPTDIAGTRVTIKDSTGSGRACPLFFVSPTQVNYQIPQETPRGPATITIVSGNGKTFEQNIQIETVAPGLFSANASGRGIAAAQVQCVKSDGTSTYEDCAFFDVARGQMMPIPIDLSSSTDPRFLILYGTGIRLRTALTAVTARIGERSTSVSYAGSQNGYVGVDQINVAIPRELAGRGEVDIILSVDGRPANVVRVKIK